MIGEIIPNETKVSMYQESEEITQFIVNAQKDYQIGYDVLTKPFEELNDRSVTQDENRGQLMFNAFVDETVEDPHESWKWRGTMSRARNKAIGTQAQLSTSVSIPSFLAQNEFDETDRDFSEVMQDGIEWLVQPTVSNYQSSFFQITFGILTNPVTYLGAEYFEIIQTIRERQEDGSILFKEEIDEVLSGFKCPIYSSTQILITNAYERNIQKQRRVISHVHKEYHDLEAKYGHHRNWEHVKAGRKTVYNPEDGLFYDIYDEDNPFLVTEDIVKSRRDDSEVPFVGGIYMGEDDIEANLIRHRDNRGMPKINVIPFGFNRIGEHFYFFKSQMNALSWNNMLYDAMNEIVMNRSLLEVEIPLAFSGVDKIDTQVIFPGATVPMPEDAKVQPLLPPSNLAAGLNAIRETEKSMDESSIPVTSEGQLPEADQKVRNVALAQANAKKLIRANLTALADSVVQYGDLMKDIFINHYTIAQVDQLVGGQLRMRYRSFLIPDKSIAGKMVSKNIRFDESLIGREMSERQQLVESYKLLDEVGFPNQKTSIYRVNPEMFARFKYLTKIDIEQMFTKTNEYWQPILERLYLELRDDPSIEREKLLRRLMYTYFESDGDDFVRNEPLIENGKNGIPNEITKKQPQNKELANIINDTLA